MKLKNLEPILSKKEIEVVWKRLNNRSITQTESNYLSRSIRPKLKASEFAVSNKLISLLNYRRKKYERKDNILRSKIMEGLKDIHKNVKAVIIFGSYVRNFHSNYRDVDVMVVLDKKVWNKLSEKNRLEKKIESKLEIKTDINLVVYKELIKLLPYSPVLQTQLEDYKVVYGRINLDKKLIINKNYLKSKLLGVEGIIELGRKIKSGYIYNAIRNCLAIKLFLNKKIDNKWIIRNIENNIGKRTVNALISDKANLVQRDIGLRYLKYLYKKIWRVLDE